MAGGGIAPPAVRRSAHGKHYHTLHPENHRARGNLLEFTTQISMRVEIHQTHYYTAISLCQ